MSAVLQQLMRKLRLAIGTGIAKLVDDARKIQQMQVTLLDSEVRSQVNRMQDYGFTSVPENGAEALVASVGGNRNHLVVVRCDDGRYRKKNLQPGEVAMYHKTGSYVLMKANGDIEAVSTTKIKATAPNIEMVASTQVTITSPTVSMSGDLNVTGIVTGGTVKQGGIVLGTHKHGGVQAGAAQTGTPV